MVKRTVALLLVLLLAAGSGLAELKLKDQTPAQAMLKNYIAHVNEFLAENGEEEINRIFDQQDTVAELGITATNDAEVPESVTVTVYMTYGNLHYLLLRVDDAARFPKIAAAFLQALNPKTMSQEDSLKKPTERAAKAIKTPTDSFEDEVEEEMLQGTLPRTFYAYYPNQYHNNINWIQLTIIFPQEGFWDEENGIISGSEENGAPYTENDQDEGYEGYFSSDDFSHLETFATPTPEPDSAAAEFDPYD